MKNKEELISARENLMNTMTRIRMEYPMGYAPKITGEYIDWENVEDVQVGNTLTSLNDSVSTVVCTLDYFTDNLTILNVVVTEGGDLPLHKHSDRWEYIYVIEGEIVDKVNYTYTKEGFVYKIPPNTPHHIYSETGALLMVTFKPKYVYE